MASSFNKLLRQYVMDMKSPIKTYGTGKWQLNLGRSKMPSDSQTTLEEIEPKMVSVDAEALRQLLSAIVGPPHYIREIQATMGHPEIFKSNPIDILVKQFNEQAGQ